MNLQYNFVIWDVHGTLTDHQLRAIKAYHQAGTQILGHGFDKLFYQQMLSRPSFFAAGQDGLSHNDFIRQYLADQPPLIINSFINIFHQVMTAAYLPTPGVRKTIHELQKRGVEMAIFTNSNEIDMVKTALADWGLSSLIPRTFNGISAQAKKPNPQAIDFIIETVQAEGLTINKDRTLLIGDYIDDIKVAHRTGVDSVLMVSGYAGSSFTLKEPRPTYIVTDPLEIINIAHGEGIVETRQEINIMKGLLWSKESWSLYGSKEAK